MPKKKTIAELKASKSYRPSRHGHRVESAAKAPIAADADATPLACPADLTTEAATLFTNFAVALVGKLEPSDVPLLARACEHLAEAARCRKAIADLAPTGLEYGRALRACMVSEASADRLLAKFDLSPSDRARIAAAKKATQPLVADVLVRPPFAIDRVTTAWKKTYPDERFPTRGTASGERFWALVEAEEVIEDAEHVRIYALPIPPGEKFRLWTEWCWQRSATYTLPEGSSS